MVAFLLCCSSVSQRWGELTSSRQQAGRQTGAPRADKQRLCLICLQVLEVICAGQASLNLTWALNISQARKKNRRCWWWWWWWWGRVQSDVYSPFHRGYAANREKLFCALCRVQRKAMCSAVNSVQGLSVCFLPKSAKRKHTTASLKIFSLSHFVINI